MASGRFWFGRSKLDSDEVIQRDKTWKGKEKEKKVKKRFLKILRSHSDHLNTVSTELDTAQTHGPDNDERNDGIVLAGGEEKPRERHLLIRVGLCHQIFQPHNLKTKTTLLYKLDHQIRLVLKKLKED